MSGIIILVLSTLKYLLCFPQIEQKKNCFINLKEVLFKK